MRNLQYILLMALLCMYTVSGLAHTIPEVDGDNPIAVISSTPDGIVFYNGDEIIFSGASSIPVSGSINWYEWDYREGTSGSWDYMGPSGSLPERAFTFPSLPTGVDEKTYQVRLSVRNTINLWGTSIITVTLKRQKARYYYVKDHLGSVRTTVDVEGNVVGYDDYYPFGLTMPGRSSTSTANDDYKFTGYELDDEAGLDVYFANARMYDPIINRFWQIDPLADQFPGWSTYNYGLNNPLKFTDPTGMAPESCPPNCSGMTFEGAMRYALAPLENLFNLGANQVEQKAQQVEQVAADATETVVKEGPEVLDVVSESSSQAAVAFGTAAMVTGGPTTPDDIAWGIAATIAGATGAISNLTATGLSVIDAKYYGGDPVEADIRVRMTAFSLSVQGVAGLFFAGQMTNAVLNAGKGTVITGAATATTAKITTEAVEDLNNIDQ